MEDAKLHRLPDTMLNFEILKPAAALAPRLGRLSVPGRTTLHTPHHIALTSRGVVPHLTQDVLKKHTGLNSFYVALEDFIERAPKQTPPLFNIPCEPDESPMRRFASLQKDALLVLGPRRTVPVTASATNTNTSISIHTAVGFHALASDYYASAAQKLRPDIVIGLGDIMHGHTKPSAKRIDKMGDRTTAWMKDIVAAKGGLDKTKKGGRVYNVFAPILPIDKELQSWYLDALTDDDEQLRPHLSGLALYDTASLAAIPDPLAALPRLALDNPASPQKLLHAVSLGMDLLTVPFVCQATDAGIVLDFEFPVKAPSSDASPAERKALGIDCWMPQYATDLSPLTPGCECYACTRHHRAYLRHLLAAKEMLGWVLIQVHNHHVIDLFFTGVRKSIENGTFEEDRAAFERAYVDHLPEKTGQGPRLRGYQFTSSGPGEPKKNPSKYRMLDEGKQILAESITPGSNADATDLEATGFAEVEK
ncbi:trna-guanine transglycosylase family protein [Diplodia corticola]|uniref:Queuine tRNA-ribosyltransferase accessory subunit 2 n=1 Tax=Diplodia corticola TaxID=236234 RepID=A0A1J9RX92_9PEZI|nr:trna-guanine transglycosylase family protein [Diplodia corticola]OJD32967.1 trna-guanine transglycosylase family protein [Diplodia corticola]